MRDSKQWRDSIWGISVVLNGRRSICVLHLVTLNELGVGTL